ncbi:element excision factor XisH family protein [Nostoc sp. WHI]|nr:element excision factor XisH family protein [Nostoc sp. WHI]
MAAKDLFHNAVKQTLLKEQWVITAQFTSAHSFM